jgi:predicted N-acetyltransferase YhbS
MSIHYLADCQEVIPQIARWLFDEWGRLHSDGSVERGMALLQERLHRNSVPLTLVATEGEAVIGTVSLVPCDMETRPDLSPWLASLYVVPSSRRRGIGSALLDAATQVAKRLGLDSLFLFTDTSEALYAKHGWEKIESCVYRNREVVVMTRRMV